MLPDVLSNPSQAQLPAPVTRHIIAQEALEIISVPGKAQYPWDVKKQGGADHL